MLKDVVLSCIWLFFQGNIVDITLNLFAIFTAAFETVLHDYTDPGKRGHSMMMIWWGYLL